MNFKTKPFEHQLEVWRESRDLESFALLWEMGTGKSKITIDTAAWLYHKGKIDALLIVAPNGVHRNWTDTEVPKHMPDDIPVYSHCHTSARSKSKKAVVAREEQLAFDGLAVLTMGYESFITDSGKQVSWQFLKNRRVLFVLDESTRIKSPSAKRTKSILKAGKYAPYRRILTGTPVANGPFDLFSQFRFMDKDYWRQHGFGNFTSFKAYFGVFRKGFNAGSGREFQQLLEYRNEDELGKMVAKHSSRVTKDVLVGLPPKLYSVQSFDLTPKMRKVYNSFKSDSLEEILETVLETGVDMPPSLAIVLLLRLQQITCGYLPDPSQELVSLEDKNPRLALLAEICGDVSHQTIIWARFTKDIDLICDLLGKDAVRYDGKTGDDDRALAIKRFQDGDVKYFVGNPAAAGEGLTLTAAQTVIYYNNSFKLTERQQSEDRAHRHGQEHPVNYIDLVCNDTIDEKIIEALRAKMNVANKITGDRLRDWLEL
mgnify:CR=1 FL=1